MRVPWWLETLAHVLAVALALWAGLHYGASHGAVWIGLYLLAGAASAALPAHRLVGAGAVGVGAIVAGVGAYLMRDAWSGLSLGDIAAGKGGVVSPAREVLALAITVVTLLAGGAISWSRA